MKLICTNEKGLNHLFVSRKNIAPTTFDIFITIYIAQETLIWTVSSAIQNDQSFSFDQKEKEKKNRSYFSCFFIKSMFILFCKYNIEI